MILKGVEYQSLKTYAKLNRLSDKTALECVDKGRHMNGSKMESITLLGVIFIKV